MKSPTGENRLQSTVKKGFILGTSFEHYRAWTMWMNDTRATRVSGTAFHKHKYISIPFWYGSIFREKDVGACTTAAFAFIVEA